MKILINGNVLSEAQCMVVELALMMLSADIGELAKEDKEDPIQQKINDAYAKRMTEILLYMAEDAG